MENGRGDAKENELAETACPEILKGQTRDIIRVQEVGVLRSMLEAQNMSCQTDLGLPRHVAPDVLGVGSVGQDLHPGCAKQVFSGEADLVGSEKSPQQEGVTVAGAAWKGEGREKAGTSCSQGITVLG